MITSSCSIRAAIGFVAIGLACLHPTYGEEISNPSLPNNAPPSTLRLKDNWHIQSSAIVGNEGEKISAASFTPDDWHPTSVPSTVLNTLTKAGVYPDLRIGLNGFQIPDASDDFNKKHDLAKFSHLPDKRNPWKDPWWYRTEFTLPSDASGKRVWLNFDGVNYRADVWVNGQKIADGSETFGVYSRFRFDITDHVRAGEKNCLAVRTHLVDHPGEPDTQLRVFGPYRQYRKDLMKDISLPMTIGYDCSPHVPDRHLGLWQPVSIEFTGPVDLRNPFVKTELPLPDTTSAKLTVSTELVNTTKGEQKGVLSWTVKETGQTGKLDVTLPAGATREIVLSPDEQSSLVVKNPKLWWPNGYGDQPLYHLELQFETGGKISDVQRVPFGIRQITRELHERNGHHGLRVIVNGQKIFCRGGYLQPEILYDWDADRMEKELRYLKEANLNITFFFELPFPPEEFIEICDRYGIMYGNCFYSGHWMLPGTPYPLDTDALARGTEDVIKRIRNHPSLFLYMAANENTVREDVYTHWRKAVQELDGTRIHIPSGYYDWKGKTPDWIKPDEPVGIGDPPPKSYGWEEPAQWYRWVLEKPNWMFMLESGSASPPPVDSLRRFIPDLFEADPSDKNFPLTSTWAHHGANSYYRPFYNAMRDIYGKPESVADFCRKGWPLTADQHRSMYEAVNHRMWDITSGYSEWCLNSCFPTVQWQMYDWYLRPVVSYYYIKKACEPRHVQLSPIDRMVSVINVPNEPLEDVEVTARLFDLDSRLRWQKKAKFNVSPSSYKETFAIEVPEDITSAFFVKLELRDSAGKQLSENFYWLPKGDSSDLGALSKLKPVKLETTMTTETRGDETIARVKVHNPSDQIAFFVHLVLIGGPGGEEVAPVLWDDNYFSLTPGETRELTARVGTRNLKDTKPVLEVGGWNVLAPFECTELVVSEAKVKANQEFTVRARISGTNLDGSDVQLFIDDEPVQSRLVYARAGTEVAERDVEFRESIATPGRHRVRVGDQRSTIIVE